MNTDQYLISSDSRRWWWAPAAVGATVAAMAVAIPVSAGYAVRVSCGPASTTTACAGAALSAQPGPSSAACPPPPDPRYVGVPWVPPEPTGCRSMDRWWTMIAVSAARR